MAKQLKPGEKGLKPPNPVAKNAFKFNKAQIFRDQRTYSRKAKHIGMEPFIMKLGRFIIKGSRLKPTLH